MKRVISAGVVGVTLGLMLVLPALAAELTSPCSMEVRSFDGPDPQTSTEVDAGAAAGPIVEGAVGSQTRPFKVDPEGSIDFAFHTGSVVFQNNHWEIYAEGLPVPILSGLDDNPLDVDETGIVTVEEQINALPFKFVGVLFISGDLWGNSNASHCHGEGFVEILGEPIGTIPWYLAAALILVSGLMLLVATPYSTTWETDPNSGERLHTGPINPTPDA